MKLEEAQQVGSELLQQLSPHCDRIALAGSVRRMCAECNDIDIVAEVTNPFEFGLTVRTLMPTLPLRGPKIWRGIYKEREIDLYVADSSTYDTLLLIRTGSKNHNIRLTTTAISKQLKLKADGTGLIDKFGNILAKTEKEIFEKLGLAYLRPEERNGFPWRTA